MAKRFTQAKVLFFDLMGTCCDWHTSILSVLSSLSSLEKLPQTELGSFAKAWRAGFFKEIHRCFSKGLEQEDIDVIHRRVLDSLLAERGVTLEEWDNQTREQLARAWHNQRPWPDTVPALQRLKEKFFIIVLANGTTRLQLDIVKSSKLPFHTLFSSQLLGLTKPDPLIYRKAADLVGCKIESCVMVAAHAYDLRAAKTVGMRTVYIRRKTEDPDEDFKIIERDVDVYLDARDSAAESGLGLLADFIGC
jgi:2-haloalkanoic acid dehalogenase type II